MVLDDAVDAEGAPSPEVLQLAFLNSALESGIDNPLDAAIVAAGERAKLTARACARSTKFPTTSSASGCRSSSRARAMTGHLLVTKGAFANVLAICTTVRGRGGSGRSTKRRAPGSTPTAAQHGRGRASACSRSPRGGCAARPLRSRRRERDDARGFPALPRPAEARRRADDPRPRRARHPRQDDHRRQPSRRRPRRRRDRPRSRRDAHRRRDRAACKDEALWHLARAHRSVRRGRPAAEGADRPRAPADRPLGRLPRRRHQRRAGAARGRRRHLDRPGGRRRARERGRRAPPARPRRPAARRRGRPPDVRQHAEVHLHHDQRQLRQHGEHGLRDAAAAVPAARRQADPAEQPAVGPAVGRHLDRQRRPRPGRQGAAVGHPRRAAVHGRSSV